MRVEVGL